MPGLLHDIHLCERGTTTSKVNHRRALRARGRDVEISHRSNSPANVPVIVQQNAHFIPMVRDAREKASIIATADVVVTADHQGEAFGAATAEALQLGIPTLASCWGPHRAQIEMLDGLGGFTRGPSQLKRILRALSRGEDPSSPGARRARADESRPGVVSPRLDQPISLASPGLAPNGH